MKKKPNVLWLMSDQHNANCTSYRNHPNVKTPNLDRIKEKGVDFTNAYANSPICSPSRVCFATGQYIHTHGIHGNYNFDYPKANTDTLPCLFRRYGYQTALIGKSHMVGKWDSDGFEHIRYCDLIDSDRGDPTTTHYFKYLDDLGLADLYEEGTPKSGQEYTLDGSAPARLPYEHSIERFTGRETIRFIENRDESRPFFIKMSFQRPHGPIAPSKEHFDMYNADDIELPGSAIDYFENRFAGKPSFMQDRLKNGCDYPLADPNENRLKRCLASYYALITVIDNEIGKVLEKLDQMGELENTIIFYTADHGDFAGEHGLFHKNFGIYDSIQKIPFLISYPGGPKGIECDEIIESIDIYSTICDLCNITIPEGREGISVVPVLDGKEDGKDAAYCEWSWGKNRTSSIRTKDFRLVVYQDSSEGELYDHMTDHGEIKNRWSDSNYSQVKLELIQKLLQFTMNFATESNSNTDEKLKYRDRYSPGELVQFNKVYWSSLKKAYEEEGIWV
jgi:arylsulfatase A-like enzyme